MRFESLAADYLERYAKVNKFTWWGPEDNDSTSLTCETATAEADLLAVVDHLREIADHREASGLDMEDWRLADMAAGWADELGRFAAEITQHAVTLKTANLLSLTLVIRAAEQNSPRNQE